MAAGPHGRHNEAAALVQRMTLQEKASLCSGRGFWHLKAVERLGLGSVMVTDGPHGLRKQARGGDHVGLNASVPATCFPTAAAMACSWDPTLLREVGEALGRECVQEDVAVLLGPGVNIKRHPLCGRNFEYYSEDPLLAGELAAAWIDGVQSQGVGTSLKHYAVNNQEAGRMTVDAVVDERTLREIYLRAFEIAVTRSQPWTVMCAYNRVNGTYCGDNEFLLNEVLRREWGFRGLVVSDWGATNRRVQGLACGLDLEMPGSGGMNDRLIEQAVGDGTLPESVLDRTATRIAALMLAGADIRAQDTESDPDLHHALARRVAAESMVLLRNDNALLPLATGSNVAVIGSFAQLPRFQGTGSSQVNPTRVDDAYSALVEAFGRPLHFARGYDQQATGLDQSLIDAAVETARDAEVAILFVGLPGIYESEGFDRTDMRMPEQHLALLEAVCAANPRTVVVLVNGAPVDMTWADRPAAILATYLAGQAGGSAIAEVLTGHREPGGRLAETLAWRQSDIPSDPWFPGNSRQVQYREGLFVGYRYFDTFGRDVAFPFGHGLGYTHFDYERVDVPVNWTPGEQPLTVRVTLTNSGERAGSDVVQVYVAKPESVVYRPAQELRGFTKVFLQPGEITEVSVQLDRRAFACFDVGNNDWVVEPGDYEIRVGASSRDIRLRRTLTLSGDSQVSEAARHAAPGFNGTALHVPDSVFQAMLGRHIPVADPVRPFHRNSTLEDIATTRLGAFIKRKAEAAFLQRMGGAGNDATLNKMMEEMVRSMPLRAFLLFGGMKVSSDQLDALLLALNGGYVRSLVKLLRSLG